METGYQPRSQWKSDAMVFGLCDYLTCVIDVYKKLEESRAVAEKLHDAIVKFDTYRNLQWHRAVLCAIAQLSCSLSNNMQMDCTASGMTLLM